MRSVVLLLLILTRVALANEEPSDEESAVASPVRWIAPVDPDVELFTLRKATQQEMMICRPNLREFWQNHFPHLWVGPATNKDPITPSIAAEYLGTEGNRDHYKIITDFGDEAKTRTTQAVYSGNETVVYEDKEFRVALRPTTSTDPQ